MAKEWPRSAATVSIVVALVFAGITMLAHSDMVKLETQGASRALSADACNLGERLTANIALRAPTLRRMADRWTTRGGTPKHEWEQDAHAHIRDMSDVLAIEWVDRSYHVRWIVPLAANEAAAGLNLAAESRMRSALEDSRTRREPTATQSIDLVQGGKERLLLFPV